MPPAEVEIGKDTEATLDYAADFLKRYGPKTVDGIWWYVRALVPRMQRRYIQPHVGLAHLMLIDRKRRFQYNRKTKEWRFIRRRRRREQGG